jgi:malto-oligosyltrehalose synthase/4-alpha-glucanotransferase
MYVPSSTYRIQFNKDFTFKQLLENIDNLASLGIGAIYASPVFSAVPGSNHGYDVTNPLTFNREIGTPGEFSEISNTLKSLKIGWIQDIVPNHMAFHPDNQWLMDVLEKGKQSAYSGYFDIDWEHPDFRDKLMVPILGKSLQEAIRDRELTMQFKEGGLSIAYYDFTLPVSAETFHQLLEENKEIEGAYYVGQSITGNEYKAESVFHGFGWSNNRERSQAVYDTDESYKLLIDNICVSVNNDPVKLEKILHEQNYVLTHWQEVEKHLNYRRFFTINGLISLAMEKDLVFENYHSLIEEMVKKGMFQGIRIDHVDGLKEPTSYFEKLRAKMGDNVFIVVEKILERTEELQKDWPLQGTSGYDFLALVNNLFTNQQAVAGLLSFYKEITKTNFTPEELIYQQKKMILEQSFGGDLDNLCRHIECTGLVNQSSEITWDSLRESVGEFLVNCPVYKLYSSTVPLTAEDEGVVKLIISKSIKHKPALESSFKLLQSIFLDEYTENPEVARLASGIFLRFMQYSGPLMAKGVEDTAMYIWNAFLAHNEVGDSIEADGISVKDFHARMFERQKYFPMSMNATATHDTKRGEDSRARLNVLSDFPAEWKLHVKGWIHQNKSAKTAVNGMEAPDVNEEYFIYQTLLGAWPMDGKSDEAFPARIESYLQKALREAKVHSNWNQPDEAYENAVLHFVRNIFNSQNPFNAQFQEFFKLIRDGGIINSLSQVVLKCTCPGIPDFYQGTELWDLSLVDPDNRRAVDYLQRKNILYEISHFQLEDPEGFLKNLYDNRIDGKLKFWFAHQLMNERMLNPDVFIHGDYIPLEVKGRYRSNVLAFARHQKTMWYLTIIPLNLSKDITEKFSWEDTEVVLPPDAPGHWQLLWDNRTISGSKSLKLGEILLYSCPVVLKAEKKDTGRGAGVLLHITSLPGKYGSGSFGEEAHKFVDFLKEANQKFWQILPFNPTGGSFSPYSSSSAFAGNVNWIDPEYFFRKKLITKLPDRLPESDKSDFEASATIRKAVLSKAYKSFTRNFPRLMVKKYQDFCEAENYWLDDYALFEALREEFGKKSWIDWPDEIKRRNPRSLAAYHKKHGAIIGRVKFEQFIFNEQFLELKYYANSRGIKIIGDMPIYVSYESVDVWAHAHLFNLNNDLQMKTVAGVPPDYFSNTGQLWNMPVYRWETMKSDGYAWWKKRINRNLSFCNMLRFDHFRGFASYWEVPFGESTAVNGQWIKGPGEEFFSELRGRFPEMPFIAEDLGDIDEDVHQLRDKFNLPGMKVLQFAFGEDMPESFHIPHMHTPNSVVYTGTHDNNTIMGWYNTEIDKQHKNNIAEYLWQKVSTNHINEEFIRMAYSSVAKTVIIPIQDILGLDEAARFNTPSQPEGNWSWKIKENDLDTKRSQYLKELVRIYGR